MERRESGKHKDKHGTSGEGTTRSECRRFSGEVRSAFDSEQFLMTLY